MLKIQAMLLMASTLTRSFKTVIQRPRRCAVFVFIFTWKRQVVSLRKTDSPSPQNTVTQHFGCRKCGGRIKKPFWTHLHGRGIYYGNSLIKHLPKKKRRMIWWWWWYRLWQCIAQYSAHVANSWSSSGTRCFWDVHRIVCWIMVSMIMSPLRQGDENESRQTQEQNVSFFSVELCIHMQALYLFKNLFSRGLSQLSNDRGC